jgi:YidC/Oxa1 family membrane protein insertase
MPIIGPIFTTLFLQPIVNLLVVLYLLFHTIGLPGALGFAIILLTVALRMAVWPIMASQIKSTKKMAELKPHLQELQKKHATDKQALAQAQMSLYKEHGINPASGCLPIILQIAVFIALNSSIAHMFDAQKGLTEINNLLYSPSLRLDQLPDTSFFGFNLIDKPANFATLGYALLLIPVITVILQFILSKMMTPQPVHIYPKDTPKEKEEKGEQEDLQSAMQSQMTFMLPIMMGYFSFTFPVGTSIYIATLTLVGIFQQYMLTGWGSLASLFQRGEQTLPVISEKPQTTVRVERTAPTQKKRSKKNRR